MKQFYSECLVIGAGLSGLTAARALVRSDIRPTILFDGRGASPWVHGIGAPVHPDDSADIFFKDTMDSGVVNDPALAHVLCADAPLVVREVREMGLSFNSSAEGGYQLLRPLGASRPRVISIGNETGPAIMQKLLSELKGKADVFPSCRALRLIVREGRVQGAVAYSKKEQAFLAFFAKAVILASGGFCSVFPQTTNKKDAGGDAAAMTYYAGAQLRDMEFIQFEPSGAVWPESLRGTSMITTMFFDGAVMRNTFGQRFMDERVPKDVMAREIAREINSGRGTEHGGIFFDATGVGRERLNEAYPMYVKRYRDVGIDLAEQMIELAPAAHTSLGGAVIDASCASTLPGLFVCGEAAGGVHGANRIGGSAGLETLVFGRRAGYAAAAYVKTVDAPNALVPDDIPSNPPPASLRVQMQETLGKNVGVLRCEAGLCEAEQTLDALLKQVSEYSGFEAMRLENDLTAAMLLTKSALCRRESLGCHTRTDSTKPASLRYYTLIQKNSDGSCAVCKEAVCH